MSQNDTGYFLAKAKANNAPNISGISETQRTEILAWLQGAVYVWCQVNGSDQLAGFNLVGDKNKQWIKTPLYCLYKKHIDAGKDRDAAYKQASRDADRLLAWLVEDNNDKRDFTTQRGNTMPLKQERMKKRLIQIAQRQIVITYEDLGEEFKFGPRNPNFHDLLAKIGKETYSEYHVLLPVVVIHKGKTDQLPGPGFFELTKQLVDSNIDPADTPSLRPIFEKELRLVHARYAKTKR